MLITISTKPIVKNMKQKTKYFRNKNILIETKYHIEITYLQFPNLHIIHIPEYVIYTLHILKPNSLSFTCSHSFSFVRALVFIRHHFLSFIANPCTTRFHSMYHSSCLFINDLCRDEISTCRPGQISRQNYTEKLNLIPVRRNRFPPGICVHFLILFINKTLPLNNLRTRTAMNAKISMLVICVEAIIYLLLYNMHDCTFKLSNSLRHLFAFFISKIDVICVVKIRKNTFDLLRFFKLMC